MWGRPDYDCEGPKHVTDSSRRFVLLECSTNRQTKSYTLKPPMIFRVLRQKDREMEPAGSILLLQAFFKAVSDRQGLLGSRSRYMGPDHGSLEVDHAKTKT